MSRINRGTPNSPPNNPTFNELKNKIQRFVSLAKFPFEHQTTTIRPTSDSINEFISSASSYPARNIFELIFFHFTTIIWFENIEKVLLHFNWQIHDVPHPKYVYKEKKTVTHTHSPDFFIRFSSLRKIIIDFGFVLDARQTFCWLKIKTISGKLMKRMSSEVKTLLSKIKVEQRTKTRRRLSTFKLPVPNNTKRPETENVTKSLFFLLLLFALNSTHSVALSHFGEICVKVCCLA